MKNIVILGLCVSNVVFASLYISKLAASDSCRIEGVPAEARKVSDFTAELAAKSQEIESLRAQLANVSTGVVDLVAHPSSPQPAIQPEVVEPSAVQPEAIRGLVEKLMASGMLTAQQRQTRPPTTSEKYAELIATLGLDDERADRLLALLDKNVRLFPGQPLPSQDDIRALLGDDDFATYQEYERMMPTRLFVDDLATYLAENGDPLTEDQIAAMLNLDPEIAGRLPLSYMPPTITLQNPASDDTEQMVNNVVDSSMSTFDEVNAYAEDILTDHQRESMDQYLGQQFSAQEAAADTAAVLLPGILSGGLLGASNVNTTISIMPTIQFGGQ